jgi:mercuric ion transport protein
VAKIKWQDKSYLRWLTIFITSATLLCCALPVLLVSLGLGAIVASLNYNVPGLLFLAEHSLWTLGLSALLLLTLAWVIWRPNQTCPVDPELAKICLQAKRWNSYIFWFSVTIWATGFFFSVLLLPLRRLFNL